MTARNLLWLVLGVVGVPLLIEGSNGCGFHSQASAPIDDNAYTCGCRCDAAPVTKTVTIVANSDDAEQDGANVRLGGNDLHIGPDFVGLRFVNVGLPKDATIVSAAVQFTASATDIDPATVAIVAQADSNAATFSSTANDISNRPPTVASVPWSPGPWNNNEKGPAELTPDLSPLLAELVSRADWSGEESRGAALQRGHRPASSGLVLERSGARRRAPGDVHRAPQRRRARVRDGGHRGAERERCAPAGGGRRRLPRPRDRQPEGAG